MATVMQIATLIENSIISMSLRCCNDWMPSCYYNYFWLWNVIQCTYIFHVSLCITPLAISKYQVADLRVLRWYMVWSVKERILSVSKCWVSLKVCFVYESISFRKDFIYENISFPQILTVFCLIWLQSHRILCIGSNL